MFTVIESIVKRFKFVKINSKNLATFIDDLLSKVEILKKKIINFNIYTNNSEKIVKPVKSKFIQNLSKTNTTKSLVQVEENVVFTDSSNILWVCFLYLDKVSSDLYTQSKFSNVFNNVNVIFNCVSNLVKIADSSNKKERTSRLNLSDKNITNNSVNIIDTNKVANASKVEINIKPEIRVKFALNSKKNNGKLEETNFSSNSNTLNNINNTDTYIGNNKQSNTNLFNLDEDYFKEYDNDNKKTQEIAKNTTRNLNENTTYILNYNDKNLNKFEEFENLYLIDKYVEELIN